MQRGTIMKVIDSEVRYDNEYIWNDGHNLKHNMLINLKKHFMLHLMFETI